MESKNNLQTALQQFDVFYKNVLDLKQKLKQDNKKLPWSFLFKKSEDPVFNGIESVLLCGASIATCFTLSAFGLNPIDPYISSLILSAATSFGAVAINNILYHINNNIGGNIGRTYAKMQGDNYFDCIEYFVKKDYKNLISPNATPEQKKQDLINFCITLDNISSNMHNRYINLCDRVSSYNEKEQVKWQPILDHIKEYNTYLLNNAEKFNMYAETLKTDDNPLFVQTNMVLNNLDITNDKEHSSEYYQFKAYLENKKAEKELEEEPIIEDRHQKFLRLFFPERLKDNNKNNNDENNNDNELIF